MSDSKMFVDRRSTPELQGKAGLTHALVIGTSAYRHLLNGPEPRGHETFGLKSLVSSSLGTFAFARWLAEEYNNSEAPLATLQLLLSPTDRERKVNPALDQAIRDGLVQPATSTKVREAVRSWGRTLCDGSPANVAVLYACGHGVRDTEGVSYILLEDFGAEEQVLNGSLNLSSVKKSMAYVQAETQMYLADACRLVPLRLSDDPNHAALGIGVQLVVNKKRTKSRTKRINSITYYSTSSDRPAYESKDGTGTLFSKALIECLRRYAAGQLTGGTDRAWRVTFQNLTGALQRRVIRLARSERKEQVPNHSPGPDYLGDTSVHVYPPGAPKVPVAIQLIPGVVQPWTTCELYTVTEQESLSWSGAFPANPFTYEVQPGRYKLDVRVTAAAASAHNCCQSRSRSFEVSVDNEIDPCPVPLNLSI